MPPRQFNRRGRSCRKFSAAMRSAKSAQSRRTLPSPGARSGCCVCFGPDLTRPVKWPEEIDSVAYRVVHGGADYREAARVNAQVEADIERLAGFAPLHNPNNLTGIRAARKLFGDAKPQFAVFDTAFHRTLPDTAATYAGPHEWLDQGKLAKAMPHCRRLDIELPLPRRRFSIRHRSRRKGHRSYRRHQR